MTALAEFEYRRQAAGGLTVAWFGTTCELISDGETALLVDPFLTRTAGFLGLALGRRVLRPDPSQYERWIAPLAPPIRAMPVTHTHFDHILDAGVAGAATGAVLVGSPSSVALGRALGLPPHQLDGVVPGEADGTAPDPGGALSHGGARGGSRRFGDFTVTFLPSRHSGSGGPAGAVTGPVRFPARLRDLRQGGTFSLLIEHPSGNLLCHNSAGYQPGALAGRRADTVFLSVASMPGDLDAYLRETVDAVGASRVFLVHWDDFTRALDRPLRPLPFVVNLPRTVAALRRLRPALAVHTLPVGEPQAVGAE